MAQTHYLQDDITRIEDLINTGLVSGDTIELAGKILTCESNTVAAGITGLLATGTGTIRMLDGGNVDFSGSNPLPATVTLEGGTEENPLPSYGNYGYVGRSAAVISLRGGTTFAGNIIVHANGNWNRVQYAKIVSATNTILNFDRDIALEEGDLVGVYPTFAQNGDAKQNPCVIQSYTKNISENSYSAVTTQRDYTPGNGQYCVLLTSSFTIYGNIMFTGNISGDEIFLYTTARIRHTGAIQGFCNVKRLVVAIIGYWLPESGVCGGNANIICDILVGNIHLTSGYSTYKSVVIKKQLYLEGVSTNYDRNPNNGTDRIVGTLYCKGGDVSAWPMLPTDREEYIDTIMPPVLFNKNLFPNSELIVRTTNPRSCKIYRQGGTVTFVQSNNFPSPAIIPDAWFLVPNTISDYVWHDEEIIVDTKKTLNIVWYLFLGEQNIKQAGIQVLDGASSPFGCKAIPMNQAITLTEYILPANTPVLQWLPPKQFSWRNDSDSPKKVVLRSWCKGGQAYSRIAVVQGGAA